MTTFRGGGRQRGGCWLVVWDHYKVEPTFFLIPVDAVGAQLRRMLLDAAGQYITRQRVPLAVCGLRQWLFGGNEERSRSYRCHPADLARGQHIVAVCHTGQVE